MHYSFNDALSQSIGKAQNHDGGRGAPEEANEPPDAPPFLRPPRTLNANHTQHSVAEKLGSINILAALEVLPVALLLDVLPLQPRLDGLVLVVEVREVRHQVLRATLYVITRWRWPTLAPALP